MSSTQGITTRSKNATQHPGLVVQKSKRRSGAEAAAERQAKEYAKKEKARAKAASIKRVAEFKKDQATRDELEATPRPAAAAVAKPLRRTSRSYALIPLRAENGVSGSDTDVNEVDTGNSEDDSNLTDTDEAPTSKKKPKVVVKTAESAGPPAKVAKPQKVKLRAAIKAAKETDDEMVSDADLTPKGLKSKAADSESDTDQEITGYVLKPKSWPMPSIGSGNGNDGAGNDGAGSDNGDGGRSKNSGEKERSKGKAKAKTIIKHQPADAEADNQNVPGNRKLALPKL